MKSCPNILLSGFIFLICACERDPSILSEEPDIPEAVGFTVDEHCILRDGSPFIVKGVVYVPGYPGYLPWEIEQSTSLPEDLKNSIHTDLVNIQAMGANTVRFWGAPRYCYEVIRELQDLSFIQTIWINGEAPDFQTEAFKETTRSYIRQVIDRIYAVYDDQPPPLVAYLIGNELSESSILSTNALHPDIKSFSGQYIHTDSNITASQAFIAEMADYARTYEFDTYGGKTLLSYANDIRTVDLMDTPFLDFISHNAYSYAVPYYRPGTTPGSSSGTLFQGWIEEIKSRHPDKPLLITETGLSVSPNAAHTGPPNYGYGGNTEEEQVTGLLQNISDIHTSALPNAGVCIHEYLDAWWKFGLEDSYSQDPDDIEEWFGIVRLTASGDWYTTEFRGSYEALQNLWK